MHSVYKDIKGKKCQEQEQTRRQSFKHKKQLIVFDENCADICYSHMTAKINANIIRAYEPNKWENPPKDDPI